MNRSFGKKMHFFTYHVENDEHSRSHHSRDRQADPHPVLEGLQRHGKVLHWPPSPADEDEGRVVEGVGQVQVLEASPGPQGDADVGPLRHQLQRLFHEKSSIMAKFRCIF